MHGSTNHPDRGSKADHALTSNLDHLMGAGQWRNGTPAIDSINPPISLKGNLNWMAGRLGAPAVQY